MSQRSVLLLIFCLSSWSLIKFWLWITCLSVVQATIINLILLYKVFHFLMSSLISFLWLLSNFYPIRFYIRRIFVYSPGRDSTVSFIAASALSFDSIFVHVRILCFHYQIIFVIKYSGNITSKSIHHLLLPHLISSFIV